MVYKFFFSSPLYYPAKSNPVPYNVFPVSSNQHQKCSLLWAGRTNVDQSQSRRGEMKACLFRTGRAMQGEQNNEAARVGRVKMAACGLLQGFGCFGFGFFLRLKRICNEVTQPALAKFYKTYLERQFPIFLGYFGFKS